MPSTVNTTITTNGNTRIGSAETFQSAPAFSGSIAVKVTGTATWSLSWSPDQGVTLIPLKDATGATVQGTATGGTNFWLGKGRVGAATELWLTVSGIAGTVQTTVLGS